MGNSSSSDDSSICLIQLRSIFYYELYSLTLYIMGYFNFDLKIDDRLIFFKDLDWYSSFLSLMSVLIINLLFRLLWVLFLEVVNYSKLDSELLCLELYLIFLKVFIYFNLLFSISFYSNIGERNKSLSVLINLKSLFWNESFF